MTLENENRMLKYGIIIAFITVFILLYSCNSPTDTIQEQLNDYTGVWNYKTEALCTIEYNNGFIITDSYFGTQQLDYRFKGDSLILENKDRICTLYLITKNQLYSQETYKIGNELYYTNPLILIRDMRYLCTR